MQQRTLTGFENYGKTTRRARFLAEMERVVPWAALCAVIEPHYPKTSPEGGRPALSLERMLRVYFLQQWFNLGDPAVEEALYDSAAMRIFGFKKVRYRGLAKNRHRLEGTAALANLFMVRRQLLQLHG